MTRREVDVLFPDRRCAEAGLAGFTTQLTIQALNNVIAGCVFLLSPYEIAICPQGFHELWTVHLDCGERMAYSPRLRDRLKDF